MKRTEMHALVMAELLNSEEDPTDEIASALEAVAEFAKLECEQSEDAFVKAATMAYRRVKDDDVR